MPLPAPLQAWPPRPYDKVAKAVNECAVWWEGDPDKIGSWYGASAGGYSSPAQFNGGIVGTVARMFWGKPQNNGQATRRVHVPVAADLASTSATLLFSQPPSFEIAENGGNAKAKERLDKIINTAEVHSKLLVAGETSAALGGTYVRIIWNKNVADAPWLDFVDPERAFPEYRYGRLHAVTLWSVLEQDNPDAVLRHVEVHESGTVNHGLYLGTHDNLGHKVDLALHPVTEPLAVTGGIVQTGVKGITAGYIPNARPNPEWRKDGQLVHLGRPDISKDVIGLMDQIDETYSSLARDVRLAKGRIVVAESLLDVRGPGKGSSFDIDREVFNAVQAPPSADKPLLSAHQFDIRVSDHLQTAHAYLREILRRVGYSPLTFGLPDEAASAMTATEVTSKVAASVATHTAKSRLWQATLAPIVSTLLEIDAKIYGTGVVLNEFVEVNWPAAARESELIRAQTIQALDTAKAVSTETKVRMLHTDWDDKRVQQEVQDILDEQAGPALFDPAEPIEGPDADPAENADDTDENTDEDPIPPTPEDSDD